MLQKRSRQHSTQKWPYTPEPSPPLQAAPFDSPIGEDFKMSSEHATARPISVNKDRAATLSHSRPTLDDVLEGRAPAPYTLAAYTAFLSQQHCLETLEFVTESKKYADKHDEYIAHYSGMPMTSDTDEGFELMQDWTRLMDVYIKPGAPREINLPAEERDDLIDEPYQTRPPKPETLEPAMQRMRDLMSDSIFIPFCNSVRAQTSATYSASSDFVVRDSYDRLGSSLDERRDLPRKSASTGVKGGASGSVFQPSRSPPQRSNMSPVFSAGFERPGGSRLTQHLSNTSVQSDTSMTDVSDSASRTSTGERESVMTPPLTPPTSNMALKSSASTSHAPLAKPTRSDSGGGWKKMGMKIFGQKKKFGEDS